MRAKAPPRLLTTLAALTLVLVAPAPAAATTMANYHELPTEHDDLGRSDEPDGLLTTVLGGEPVRNRVLDMDLNGRSDDPQPPASGRLLAPGCTDDLGRQPSGMCGLWTIGASAGAAGQVVPPRTAGTEGMSGTAAPGLTQHKAAPVRFLDLQIAAATTGQFRMFDLNRKVDDLDDATGGLLSGLGIGDLAVGPSSLWAWYGEWQDRNGNGVIDHLVDEDGDALPDNEFLWIGDCDAARGDCIPAPGLTFPVWLWPGDHHQWCGFLIACFPLPADYPGREVVCLASSLDDSLRNMMWCPPERTDAADPLLGGAQEGIAPDGLMRDQTGSGDPARRMWTYGTPPMWFYDQSLLLSLVVVGGVGDVFRAPDLATGYSIPQLDLVDVDRYPAVSPLLEPLVQGLKSNVGALWGLARDAWAPLLRTADGLVHNKAVDDHTRPLAPVDDMVRDPGWSREPNHPGDRFPGARYLAHAPLGVMEPGEQAHRGWRNDYAAHDGAWHAWADLHARRVNYIYEGGFGYRDSASMLPVAGGPLLPDPSDHARTLDPGVYMVDGFVGAWKDRPHAMAEDWYDPLGNALGEGPLSRQDRYTLPPDGWVGNIVETTGAYRSRGYGEETCAIAGVQASFPWAWCNPYANADLAEADSQAVADQSFGLDLSDPQDYRDVGEFVPFDPVTGGLPPVVLQVEGGTWTFPVLVWRDYYGWDGASAPDLEVLTGHAGPIALATLPRLMHGLRLATTDLLILPAGNLGLDVTTSFAVDVRMFDPAIDLDLREGVVDVDTYQGWGAPGGG